MKADNWARREKRRAMMEGALNALVCVLAAAGVCAYAWWVLWVLCVLTGRW